ncbi:hypothetical protein [Microbulbifer hainanensis]|uniref:hypothetical protein n=1 Tax=Microbulbifer hainanensis TaxID=2735675 RepID=UPI001866589D|nr:hypothetical protein [Microbulbifer hainanensis]
MTKGFWIRRFALVYLAAAALIAGGQMARGRSAEEALTHASLWALISAAIYIAAFAYRARRGCATCPKEP